MGEQFSGPSREPQTTFNIITAMLVFRVPSLSQKHANAFAVLGSVYFGSPGSEDVAPPLARDQNRIPQRRSGTQDVGKL